MQSNHYYIALLRKEKKSDYGVDFPDFPGCITVGKTLDEAKQRAGEALLFHVEGLLEDGEPLPEPSSLESVMHNRENRDSVAFLVEIPGYKHKAIRVNITLDEKLLDDATRYAHEHGLSRSGLIADAVRHHIY